MKAKVNKATKIKEVGKINKGVIRTKQTINKATKQQKTIPEQITAYKVEWGLHVVSSPENIQEQAKKDRADKIKCLVRRYGKESALYHRLEA